MTNEHFMIQGKRLDNGKIIKGYYYREYPYQCFENDEKDKHFILYQNNMDWGLTNMVKVEIDFDTIEHIAVSPIFDMFGLKCCPNCNSKLRGGLEFYCEWCGQKM